MIPGLSNGMLLMGGIAVATIGFLALIIAGVYKRVQTSERSSFEHKDIEKLIRPEIKRLVEYWGSSSNMKLRYKYDVKGKVVRHIDYTSDINDSTAEDSEEKKKSVDIDKEQLEQDYEDGKVSERVYRMITEFGQEKVHILLVRPVGVMNKLAWKLSKTLSTDDVVSDIIIVPDRLIRDDVDYLTILDKAQMQRFAGMDVAVEASVFNFIESITYRNLYSQALQDQQNYHRQVNFYSSEFAQELQQIREENRQERKKYQGRTSGMVNED